MLIAILILVFAILAFWLIFFRFKWLKLTPGKGIVFLFFVVHFFLVFMIGLRFITPKSTNVTVVQHTIQMIPRLPEPTLVTDVLVEENVLVKKGAPLFQLDQRPYQYKVEQVEASLAEAKQNVLILEANIQIAEQNVDKALADYEYAKHQEKLFNELANEDAVRGMDVEKWRTQVKTSKANYNASLVELMNSRLKYDAQVNGVHTTVANLEAQLSEAKYYLDNTTLRAPEDGRIINIQVRPGMVSGILRVGGIAAFIVEADRYVLATFYQENLKKVKEGQPVEVALNMYPGQIFQGKVVSIWKANGMGQYLPKGEIPKFHPSLPEIPQDHYAVKIYLDDPDQVKFPIGAQGRAAIYTSGETGSWASLRKIAIRGYSWSNWLYPLDL